MTLEERITTDIKAAMKAKDKVSLRGLRSIKSAITLLQTSGKDVEVTEEDEIKLLQKMVKQRKESLDIFTKQGRADLAEVEEEEIGVIEKYLPEQLSEDDIKAIVKEIIESTGAQGMKDMGKVMGQASAKLAGRADGKTLAGLVRTMLNS